MGAHSFYMLEPIKVLRRVRECVLSVVLAEIGACKIGKCLRIKVPTKSSLTMYFLWCCGVQRASTKVASDRYSKGIKVCVLVQGFFFLLFFCFSKNKIQPPLCTESQQQLFTESTLSTSLRVVVLFLFLLLTG